MKLHRFGLALAAATSMMCAGPVLAESAWQPTQPVRLIVAFAPGGSADLLARLIQPKLAEHLGTTVVVENRAGGGGTVGTAAFAHAAPDGYTVGIGSVSSHAINPALFGEKLPYKVPSDFTPIGQINSQPSVLIAHPSLPANSVQELVAWLKDNPGEAYGSAGVGSSGHLIGQLVNISYDVKMEHAPYRSGGLSSNDLIAGHIKLAIDQITTSAQLAEAGKVKALAVSSAQRSPVLPNVPTFAEQGAPSFNLTSWQGLFGPAGMEKKIVDRLHGALSATLQDPEVRKRLEDLGSQVVNSDPATFAAYIESEMKQWGDIVKQSGVTLN